MKRDLEAKTTKTTQKAMIYTLHNVSCAKFDVFWGGLGRGLYNGFGKSIVLCSFDVDSLSVDQCLCKLAYSRVVEVGEGRFADSHLHSALYDALFVDIFDLEGL